MRRIDISDTTLSDSTHALWKSPLAAEDLLPLAETMNETGFYEAEVWGGSTFETCLRTLNENPWDRLRHLAKKLTRTRLRIIVRGQSLLGSHPQPIDVIEAFAREVAANGVAAARIFDPLNDVGNLEHVIQALAKAGVEPEGTIVYTQSPVHTVERFTAAAERLISLGCRSLCINDVAGMLTPSAARTLVQSISAHAPVRIHTRSLSGMGAITYAAAIEAGAAGVDCTVGPFAVAAAQPTVEAMLQAIEDLKLEANIDGKALRAYTKTAETIAMRHVVKSEDEQIAQSMISVHKIPIGMLSSIISDLAAINAQSRLSDVLAEVTRVREDFGWPPLTTPLSQMVAAQALQNVISGKRYESMSREVKNYLRGMYGTPPGEISPDLLSSVQQVAGRASLLLPPQMEQLESDLRKENLTTGPEDVITYALFGPLALSYFQYRRNPTPRKRVLSGVDGRLELLTSFMDRRGLRRLEIAGKDFRVKMVKRSRATTAARPVEEFDGAVDFETEAESGTADGAPEENFTPIKSPLGGTFYRSSSPGQPPFVEVGAEVTEETVIGLVEAMKLFHEIKAEKKGIIRSFAVENAKLVEQGGSIAWIEETP